MDPETFPLVQFLDAITTPGERFNVFNANDAKCRVVAIMHLGEVSCNWVIKVFGAYGILMFSQTIPQPALCSTYIENPWTRAGNPINNVVARAIYEVFDDILSLCLKINEGFAWQHVITMWTVHTFEHACGFPEPSLLFGRSNVAVNQFVFERGSSSETENWRFRKDRLKSGVTLNNGPILLNKSFNVVRCCAVLSHKVRA